MGKKGLNKRARAEDEGDENDIDPELQAEMEALAKIRQERSDEEPVQQKVPYNREGLLQLVEGMAVSALPFIESHQVCEFSMDQIDENDDLAREMAFYNHTLLAADTGRKRLEALRVPTVRPDDYFCEQVKSDQHMARIKDRLLLEEKKIEGFEQRKQRENNRKFNKQVSEVARKEKSSTTKASIQATSDLIKNKGKMNSDERSSKIDALVGGGKRKREDEAEKSAKRKGYDKKYGHADNKAKKMVDKKSLNDLSDYNPRGGKFVRREGGRGGGGRGGGGRGGGGRGGGGRGGGGRGGGGRGGGGRGGAKQRPGKASRDKKRSGK